MPLESKDHRLLTAASGYCELGMFPEAKSELDQISPDESHSIEVIKGWLEVYSGLREWVPMQALAEKMTVLQPDEPDGWIARAYATRRAESIAAAKVILLEALQRYPGEPMIRFNLACYDCQLGDLQSARVYLEHAIKLHPGLKAAALGDPDLEPLWESLVE